MTTPSFPPRVPRNEFLKSQRAIISDMLKAYRTYQDRFGEIFQVQVITRTFFVTTGPEYAGHVLVKNHRSFQKDRPSHIVGEVIGNGILTSEGDYWRRQRRIIQPSFHKRQIQNLSTLMVEETKGIVSELAGTQEPVNLHQWMTRLALRVVSRSLFSHAIDERGFQIVNDCLEDLLDFMVVKVRDPFTLLKWRLTGREKYYWGRREELDKLLFDMVDARRAEGVGDKDLMDMLLSARDAETNEPLSREELRQELISIFLAGHETSANAMTYIFMLLAEHPDILQKVVAEVDEVVGDEDITFGHLPRLTYLRQVIDEGLRLYPPAWVIGREALQPTSIGDLDLEEGDSVTIFIYGLHRNPKYWPDPERFDPDRFSEENKKLRPTHAYLPFGGGPRLCIGHQFAIFEMQIAIASILKRFTITRTNPEVEIGLIPSVTLRPSDPVMMLFSPRA